MARYCRNCIARIENRLDTMSLVLETVLERLDKIMALVDDLKAALKALDDETSLVAANIRQLVARIRNSMTDQEVSDIKAQFGTIGARLDTLAHDPTTPVPPVPAPLQTLREQS